MPILTINGRQQSVEASNDTPLLWVIREELQMTGTKFGCGAGLCGACTVHLDGRPVRSCITPVAAVGDSRIGTLAGLGTPEKPHPIQKAWLDEQVSQCAYCINGWIMTAAALLARKPHPTEAEIKDAFAPLVCRCGTQGAAIRAVQRASKAS